MAKEKADHLEVTIKLNLYVAPEKLPVDTKSLEAEIMDTFSTASCVKELLCVDEHPEVVDLSTNVEIKSIWED